MLKMSELEVGMVVRLNSDPNINLTITAIAPSTVEVSYFNTDLELCFFRILPACLTVVIKKELEESIW